MSKLKSPIGQFSTKDLIIWGLDLGPVLRPTDAKKCKKAVLARAGAITLVKQSKTASNEDEGFPRGDPVGRWGGFSDIQKQTKDGWKVTFFRSFSTRIKDVGIAFLYCRV